MCSVPRGRIMPVNQAFSNDADQARKTGWLKCDFPTGRSTCASSLPWSSRKPPSKKPPLTITAVLLMPVLLDQRKQLGGIVGSQTHAAVRGAAAKALDVIAAVHGVAPGREEDRIAASAHRPIPWRNALSPCGRAGNCRSACHSPWRRWKPARHIRCRHRASPSSSG